MSAYPTAEEMAAGTNRAAYEAGIVAGIKAERARMAKHLRELAKAIRNSDEALRGPHASMRCHDQATVLESESDALESK